LARRYRVSLQVTTNVVTNAYAAGKKYAIDPMLILAVISVESSFNPVAESAMGAKGLMQVIPRFHLEKFDPIGGEEVVFDTAANIRVGAQILREYIHRTGGDVNEGLRLYVGATTDDNENGYALKVQAERDRLHQVLQRYQNQGRQQLAQS
jgi:soluble lytic murein transglycosylase-like protein